MIFKTRITELFNIKYPIVQGGLAHLAYADLAAAVSNAGGLGQITAMSLGNPEKLRKEIHLIKNLTSKPYGINFAIGQYNKNYKKMVEVAIEEQVPVISITGGNPAPILRMVEDFEIKTLVLIATKKQAKKAEELGADAVIAVGQEGGGHIGVNDTGTIILTPHVVDHVKLPIIASGGIIDGRGLMASLALGAEGIEMGTRFIATQECIDAHSKYKEAIVNADENSTIVIKQSLGSPGRVLKNSWTDKIKEIEEKKQGYNSLKKYISGEANKRFIHDGNYQEGFGWAGQGVARISDIPTVEELIQSIVSQANKIREKWGI